MSLASDQPPELFLSAPTASANGLRLADRAVELARSRCRTAVRPRPRAGLNFTRYPTEKLDVAGLVHPNEAHDQMVDPELSELASPINRLAG
jgi:hypothetical protein